MVNVGIIGCGRITEYRHAPEYLENENVRLLGFVDTKPGQAQLMAGKFGGKDYGGIDQMLLEPAWRGVDDPIEKIFKLLAGCKSLPPLPFAPKPA